MNPISSVLAWPGLLGTLLLLFSLSVLRAPRRAWRTEFPRVDSGRCTRSRSCGGHGEHNRGEKNEQDEWQTRRPWQGRE